MQCVDHRYYHHTVDKSAKTDQLRKYSGDSRKFWGSSLVLSTLASNPPTQCEIAENSEKEEKCQKGENINPPMVSFNVNSFQNVQGISMRILVDKSH